MESGVRPLELEVKTNGHEYKLYAVQDNVYIYRQLDKVTGTTVGFECFIAEIRPKEVILGKEYPERHVFPKSDDWGYRAWTLRASSTDAELSVKFGEMLDLEQLRNKNRIERDVI